jgi:L-rhamnose mutarotase
MRCFHRLCLFGLLCFGALSCNEVKTTRLRQIVMTTDLVNDPAVIHLYDSMHSAAGVWPALEKANKAAGIHSVKIWRTGTRLMMMIEVPVDVDMAKLDSLYVSADPKVKDWGVMMSNFQRALPGVDSTQKWSSMEVIHHYEDGVYKK